MKIRLGYVAIALGLPKVTSSSNVTYAYYNKLQTEKIKLEKLKDVTYSNFLDLKKILQYNIDNKIHFYRLTSSLIPLATHPEVNWNYRNKFKVEFKIIGEIIKKVNMRVDTHPDQFNVINSVDSNVVNNTLNNLLFQANIFKDMEYEEGKMVLHIGSGVGGKEESLRRFEDNIKKFPKEITSKIILENDDKTFTARETLMLCEKLNLPMVLDVHHHLCNNNGEDIKQIIPNILDTWNGENLSPKIHISSPKDGNKDRKHADFINTDDFIEYMEIFKEYNRDIDVMIEAKKKDLALFALVRDIKKTRKDIKWIDESTLII